MVVLGDLGGAQKPGIGPWLILAVLNKLRMHRKHLLPSQARTHSLFPVRNGFSASEPVDSQARVGVCSVLNTRHFKVHGAGRPDFRIKVPGRLLSGHS